MKDVFEEIQERMNPKQRENEEQFEDRYSQEWYERNAKRISEHIKFKNKKPLTKIKNREILGL